MVVRRIPNIGVYMGKPLLAIPGLIWFLAHFEDGDQPRCIGAEPRGPGQQPLGSQASRVKIQIADVQVVSTTYISCIKLSSVLK
jgi:hypothetical protein